MQYPGAYLIYLPLAGIKGDVEEHFEDLHGSLCLLPGQRREESLLGGNFVGVHPLYAKSQLQGVCHQADAPELLGQLLSDVHSQRRQQEEEAQVEELDLVRKASLVVQFDTLGQAHHQPSLSRQLLGPRAAEDDVAEAFEGFQDDVQVWDLPDEFLGVIDASVPREGLQPFLGGKRVEAVLVPGQDADAFQTGDLAGWLELSFQELDK